MTSVSHAGTRAGVLVLLTTQNAGAVLLMRAVRALPGETEFVTQTAVVMQEVLKGLACIFLIIFSGGSVSSAWENRSEMLSTSVPALLYLAQNNLQYVAVGHLAAPVYAVTYQTKMIWVGVCSVILLGRRLLVRQWVALFLTMAGVGAVQLSQIAPDAAGAGAGAGSSPVYGVAYEKFFGVIVLLLAALCSALAGVSFEKLLKGSTASLWTRNLQLAGGCVFR
jgi:drug/metabolite transporter (DMT)-like permease